MFSRTELGGLSITSLAAFSLLPLFCPAKFLHLVLKQGSTGITRDGCRPIGSESWGGAWACVFFKGFLPLFTAAWTEHQTPVSPQRESYCASVKELQDY